jgi:two-component system sensor histidine kinase DesK
MAAGMLAYPLVTAGSMAQHGAPAVGYVVVALFACCYVGAAVAIGRNAWRSHWVLAAAMVVLFVAALPFARADGFFLAAVVTSLVAVRVRRFAAVVVAVAVVAGLVVPPLVWHDDPGWLQAITIVFTVLTVYGYAEIAAANAALVEARAEVARLASEGERARIARDLHDLLGHSLTAITVKSDLARRLSGDAARREIAGVEQLSRQALADVRAAVSGYRDVTLAGELARGRELLRASGIEADLPGALDALDGVRQELFGWAVREGLTNVVRHSRATRCVVTVSASEVSIRDDGVGGGAEFGSGLTGLRERVTAAGGSVSAGPVSPRGWRLRVTV